MAILSPLPILPRHPRWNEFIERLSGPEGCNFRDTRWTCHGTEKRFCREILTRMGLSDRAIAISLAYFEDHGGYCDCEVVLNVGSRC
ncbi:MAG TPA: DUF2695 domain-containing protein [Candidatus Dormibacteraeota bacterium]